MTEMNTTRRAHNFKDRTGFRYGRLTVVEEAGRTLRGKVRWRCLCDCGGVVVTSGTPLTAGDTRSCGCLRKEVAAQMCASEIMTTAITKHGHCISNDGKPSRTFRSWAGLKGRCTNPNDDNWDYYGGRGITVCDRWGSFENFLADMGERPEGTSIDRIDNDRGYEPSNCRWATPSEQRLNQRRMKETAYAAPI